MKPVAFAVVRSGLISSEVLRELQRWGLPVALVSVPEEGVLENPKQIVDLIQNALEDADQVKINETDLDLLTRYLDPAYRKEGTLVVKDGKQKATSKVLYSVTPLGEYAIPWVSESIADFMTNGQTYLRFKLSDGSSSRVTFSSVREVFFGDQKAFMVCTPGVADELR
jgi:hypothetical protein